MRITDLHEVSVDVYSDGKDVWTARWDGGSEVTIFRGDSINNRIVTQHMLRIPYPGAVGSTDSGIKYFCEWAENVLIILIDKNDPTYDVPELEIPENPF